MIGPAVTLVAAHPLVHVNALLNMTAAVLLVIGYVMIHRRRETAHMRIMISAFGVSILFLASYLYYHSQVGSVRFTGDGPVRIVYFALLLSHILLAAVVPLLALLTILFGLRATGRWGTGGFESEQTYRRKHRRLARWTLPIWLYVSATGVLVYWMLYHLYPSPL